MGPEVGGGQVSDSMLWGIHFNPGVVGRPQPDVTAVLTYHINPLDRHSGVKTLLLSLHSELPSDIWSSVFWLGVQDGFVFYRDFHKMKIDTDTN